jgi:hypothetical protein
MKVLRPVVLAALLAPSLLTLGQVTVTVTKPYSGFSGSSPLQFVASGSSPNGMSSMAIFVDGTSVYFNYGSSFTAYLWLSRGSHSVFVQGTDNTGATGSETLSVNSTTGQGTVSDIDDWDPWQSCTNSACAGGNGTSTTFTAPFQTSPSRDGSSRQFNLGGAGSYSNAYWYKFVGGSSTAKNFTYDVWYLIDTPAAPQALELDVNQSFNQARWVFGVECDFKDTGQWNVWDGGTGHWVATGINCQLFPANTWVHVVWQVYRAGNDVHYNSVTVNGQKHRVNIQLGRQPFWNGSDIDVSVQLDGDFQQDPYNVWVDKVNLSAQ